MKNVNGCAFSTDGAVLASASADEAVRLWNTKTFMNVAVQGHDSSVIGCDISPAGILASTSWDTNVRLWDMNTQQCIAVLDGHRKWCSTCCFTLCDICFIIQIWTVILCPPGLSLFFLWLSKCLPCMKADESCLRELLWRKDVHLLLMLENLCYSSAIRQHRKFLKSNRSECFRKHQIIQIVLYLFSGCFNNSKYQYCGWSWNLVMVCALCHV